VAFELEIVEAVVELGIVEVVAVAEYLVELAMG